MTQPPEVGRLMPAFQLDEGRQGGRALHVTKPLKKTDLMKNLLFLIVCVLAYCLVAGCKQKEAASLDQRFAAGQAVMDQKEKNGLMADLAKDAADAGDPRVVKQALGQIFEDGRRNDTAEACALKLAGAGKRAEALEVAKMITSQRQQDSVLSKLAK